MPFWTTAAIVGGALATAGASAYGAHEQAGAAQDAAHLSYKAQEDALAYQKQKDALSRSDLAPWRLAGTSAINSLSGMLQNGEFKDWTGSFQAPTSVTEQNDPGYMERMRLGDQALERSAAARGGVLSGGTAKAEQQFGQDYASNEYSNVYNRAYNEYATKYNEFENNNTQRYNRLAGVAGLGLQSTSTLSMLGQNSANNVGNILLTGARDQGNYLTNAAYQRASGYNSAAGTLGSLPYLLQMLQQQNGSTDPSYSYGR